MIYAALLAFVIALPPGDGKAKPLSPSNSVVPAQPGPDAPPKKTSNQAAYIVTDLEAECFCQDSIEDATADVTERFDIRRASGISDNLLSNLPPSYGKAKPLPPFNSVVPAQPDAPPKKHQSRLRIL